MMAQIQTFLANYNTSSGEKDTHVVGSILLNL